MAWWIYLVGLVIVVLASLVYFAPAAFFPQLKVAKAGPFDLSAKTTVFDSNQVATFEQKGSATLQAFFYIVPTQRSPTAMTCNTPGNPSCEDGRFHTCFCGRGNNCDGCKRNGYTPLLSIGDTLFLELLPAPDAGRQGKAMTQIAVRTKTTVDASGNSVVLDASGSSTNFESVIEFLPLPPLPTQKWVSVTISREGRRFDIYYNDHLVLSQKTLYNIATTAGTTGIVVGDSSLSGYGAVFDFKESITNGMEVAASYAQQSDTRGAPLVNLPADTAKIVMKGSATGAAGANSPGYTLAGLTLPSLCPTGGCVTGPTVRPAQPWLDWDTAYA
jgi:hypothetical protein